MGFGTPRTLQLLHVLSIHILRHALSCCGITPELQKTWDQVMRLCLPGLSAVGPAAFHAPTLFGWPSNVESLDAFAMRAAGSVLQRLQIPPTRELRRLQGYVVSAEAPHPLTSWLKY
eukprot:6443026-Amphidinium_carterae.1